MGQERSREDAEAPSEDADAPSEGAEARRHRPLREAVDELGDELREELREHEPRWFRRLRERIRAHRSLDLTWRVSVFLIGWAAVIVGLLGLLLPVLPGWALIFVGLALLATEFVWAQRVLQAARRRYELTKAQAFDPRRRRLVQVYVPLTGLAVAAVVTAYLAVRGVPGFVPFVG